MQTALSIRGGPALLALRRELCSHSQPAKQFGPILCLLLCGLVWEGCTTKASGPPSRRGEASVPVTVTKVVQKDIPIDLQAVGNVEAYLTVTIKAQVNGELTRAYFQEGDFVKRGDLLFSIDPRQLQAQLNQVQANLARDEAQLSQAEANLARDMAQEKYAQSEATRYTLLSADGLVSKEQSEQIHSGAEATSSAVKADMAAVRSARATMEATRASVENVKVQLGYTTIRSSLDGRTGNLNVKQGNIVTANSTDLMNINQIQPIYVTFSVPEAQFPSIRKGLKVMAVPQNGASPPEDGELTFIDNAVDPSTGTIKLKGTFPNSDRKLWPGEFVRVTLRLAIEKNALTVPNQVVQTGQDGSYVFVVNSDSKVESRPVVTGPRADQDLVIEKGLNPGDTVVLEGQLRLAPGTRVQVQDRSGSSPRGRPRR
jgi:multidrug efflux system membrane fusion protein